MRVALFGVLALLGSGQWAAAQVVVDGSTRTLVDPIVSGEAINVKIAPADRSGVSLNNYTEFSVPNAGVNLDNRAEAARTIVNEVTGSKITELAGPLEVLGQKAHVIVANKNGIAVDGARFLNTGQMVLTTGEISVEDFVIAPTVIQKNVVATTTQGTITVRGGGLSGQMDSISLLARELDIDGPVTNTDPDSRAFVSVVAGETIAKFDSSIVPGNLDDPWRDITRPDGQVPQSTGFVVRLGDRGGLYGGIVEVLVTDQGAGVSYAGKAAATSRGFTLSADGQITLTGADIRAATPVQIRGGSVSATQSQIRSSENAVYIEATKESVAGTGLTLTDTKVTGLAIDLSSKASIRTVATLPDALTLTAEIGALRLTASTFLEDKDGVYLAAGEIGLTSGTKLAFSRSVLGANADVYADIGTEALFTDANIEAGSDVFIASDTARFESVDRRGTLLAKTGGVTISAASGDIENYGTLIQGKTRTVADSADSTARTDAHDTVSVGGVTIKAQGRVENVSSEAHLAVMFGDLDDLVIASGADTKLVALPGETEQSLSQSAVDSVSMLNHHGRFLSNKNVILRSLGDFDNRIDLPNGANTPLVYRSNTTSAPLWWTLFTKRLRKRSFELDYGTIPDVSRLASVTATQNVSIEARDVNNLGGEINANAGAVTITGMNVTTEAVGSGKIKLKSVCVLSCGYESSGEVAFHGGKINAATDINITAQTSVRNSGGALVAINSVRLDTPKVSFYGVSTPVIATRPAGIYNFWRSKAAWLYLRERFGGAIATLGDITLNEDAEVELDGATLLAGGRVSAPTGMIVRAPQTLSPALSNEIGALRDWVPMAGEK